MKKIKYGIDVVDIAWQIINMSKEMSYLKQELEHYKELHEIHCKSIKANEVHQGQMLGTILSAVLDPDSSINKEEK